jgi:hypothetical protein
MLLPRRQRASHVLLLILAVGMAAAAVATAASADDMACCPPGASMEGGGCTWLGAGDCCPERPSAPVTSRATPPAPAPLLVALAPASCHADLAAFCPAPDPGRASRGSVLRL